MIIFTGLVFFRSVEIGGYSANRTCYIAISKDRDIVHLSVYEPSWQDALKIELPLAIAADGLPESAQLEDGELLIAVKSRPPIEFPLIVKYKESWE